MGVFWKALVLICIFVPLIYSLYYFGILVTRAGASWLRADISLPTRWEGHSAGTTGFMRRNFAVFKKYRQLSIEIETGSGSIEYEVKGSDGFPLSPVSGVYGRDSRILFEVSQFKRCTVTLQMKQFHGQFRITLQ